MFCITLSLLTNLMQPFWIKVWISFKKKKSYSPQTYEQQYICSLMLCVFWVNWEILNISMFSLAAHGVQLQRRAVLPVFVPLSTSSWDCHQLLWWRRSGSGSVWLYLTWLYSIASSSSSSSSSHIFLSARTTCSLYKVHSNFVL